MYIVQTDMISQDYISLRKNRYIIVYDKDYNPNSLREYLRDAGAQRVELILVIEWYFVVLRQ